MKHLTIILFIIIISCKSEGTTEMQAENRIDNSVNDMWKDFIKSHPEFEKDELPEVSYFHDNETDANCLAKLIVNGKKKASSGLYIWYEEANAELPKIGTKLIVTDFDGKARAIIETIKVDTIPFNQISKAYAALDMGTSIEPLEKWKKAHWEFFSNALEQSGGKPTEEMLIVCEYFETIWPK